MLGIVVLAAGRGKRMGAEGNKLFLPLGGQSVLSLTLCHIRAGAPACPLMVVYRPGEKAIVQAAINEAGLAPDRVLLIEGGAERQDSVRLALAALPADWDRVLIHDGARPILRADLMARLVRGLDQAAAVIPVLPVTDTVKMVDAAGYVLKTVDRASLYRVQTPQAFQVAPLRAYHQQALQAGLTVTDDAALMEAYGEGVLTVAGDPYNIKVTVPADLPLAALYLKESGLCESD
ncbi:2-C-methyl-D-erythritol 4-phosphate cytidylyltransferase [Peptococcus simiae]|uniref:2-C-methyl-D-erythritol 4-phosphate cytidylyltransferase n=1 Tax=Peptococcus simiae TaxID=1643805 RepID=A0ABW9H0H4_9FIRM